MSETLGLAPGGPCGMPLLRRPAPPPSVCHPTLANPGLGRCGAAPHRRDPPLSSFQVFAYSSTVMYNPGQDISARRNEMRRFRLLAITVLLLACVVLGSACTGAKGEAGPKGDVGADGVGVEDIVSNGDGTFTVNLTNGESYTTDNLTGPVGPQGAQGPQGVQGEAGLPGAGIAWKGEWSNSVTYGLDDAVEYEGSSYVARLDGNIAIPPTDADAWDLWVQKGDAGPQGEVGEQGPPGEPGIPGPNMIVAMGNIAADGTISQGYNIVSVHMPEEEGANPYYEITLTDIYYQQSGYVTVVTPADTAYQGLTAGYMESGSGKLIVNIFLGEYNVTAGAFSFMVLQCP